MSTSPTLFLLARVVVGALALFALIYSTMYFGRINPKEKIAARVPNYFSTDMTFGYSPADLIAVLKNYQPIDFKDHREFISKDMFYPIFYSISLAVLIACLLPAFPHALVDYRRVHYLWLLPLLAALFDYAENLSMGSALDQYQSPGGAAGTGLMRLASVMTSTKLTLLYASFLVAILGLLCSLWAAVKLLRPAASS
jgi:hypothetical protein